MYIAAAKGWNGKAESRANTMKAKPDNQEVQAGATSENCTTTYTTNPRRPILG